MQKHMQHPDEILAKSVWENRWNIQNLHLKRTCIAIATCATSRSTFATSRWNTCNIQMKNLKHLKHTLATWAFNEMSSCYLDEWRLACRCGTRHRRGGRRRRMELDGMASHEAHPLACLLKHPLWRLAGSVEAAATHQIGGGGHSEQAGRSRGEHGRTRPSSAVEVGRSERGRGGEFYFFAGCGREGTKMR
jgi:hypothetical protein